MKKTRKKLHEVSLETDIRYRGPLSYRHFKILGWLCMVAAQGVVLLNLASKYSPQMFSKYETLLYILAIIAQLSVPFLLFANYAAILNYTEGYKRQLIINGGATALIILMFLFIYNRYVVGAASLFMSEGQNTPAAIAAEISRTSSKGYYAFNIFIDLFLCTLFMFFLNHRPKRGFRGRKLIIYRLFAVLPVLYEAASVTLKLLAATEVILLPPNVYPFLTIKPPIMFLMFLILALYIKNRERRFCKFGRTHQEYMQFLKTNRNSFQFSRFAAILLAVAGAVDLFAFQIGYSVLDNQIMVSQEASYIIFQELTALGIGDSIVLLIMAPLLLLLSYTRTYKNKMPDMLIPLLGVLLIVFVYVEAAFQGLMHLPQILGG